jgi:hypothetical protein
MGDLTQQRLLRCSAHHSIGYHWVLRQPAVHMTSSCKLSMQPCLVLVVLLQQQLRQLQPALQASGALVQVPQLPSWQSRCC